MSAAVHSFAPLCHRDTVRTLQRYLRWQPWSPAMPVRGCACAVPKARFGEAALALWLSAGSRQAVGATRQRVLLLALAQPAPLQIRGSMNAGPYILSSIVQSPFTFAFPVLHSGQRANKSSPKQGQLGKVGHGASLSSWQCPSGNVPPSCHPRDIRGEDSAGLSGCSPCFCGPDALQPCTRAWVDGEKVSAQPFSP